MSDNSAIEWTDATWNPVVGCSRVSAGCDHCYAVGMTRRLEGMSKAVGLGGDRKANYRGLTIELPQASIDRGVGVNGRHFNGEVRCVEEALHIPLCWKKPVRIFVNSMSDLFHPKVPFEFIDQVFAVMALSPKHTFQVLTKRPERMAEYLAADDLPRRVCEAMCNRFPYYEVTKTHRPYHVRSCQCWPLPNVWLGTSCEDQAAADERILYLLACPAAIRFLSCEPLLGPINLNEHWLRYTYGTARMALVEHEQRVAEGKPIRRPALGAVDWVIVGGESGTRARVCNVDWIRSIVQQCSGVLPCFVKQLGSFVRDDIGDGDEWPPCTSWETNGCDTRVLLKSRKGGEPSEWPEDLRVREMPGVAA